MAATSRQERSRARWLAASAACASLALVAGAQQVMANGWQSFVFRGPGIGASAEQQDDAEGSTQAAEPETPDLVPAPTEPEPDPAAPSPEDPGPAGQAPDGLPAEVLPEELSPDPEQARVSRRSRPPRPRHHRHGPPQPPGSRP